MFNMFHWTIPKEKANGRKKTELACRIEKWDKGKKEHFVSGNVIYGHNVPMENGLLATGYIGKYYKDK